MTTADRENAANFFEFTTIKPFLYQQPNFKCFYCYETFPEIPDLSTHVDNHKIPDRPSLLKKYVRKGKRDIKVDISNLKCKMCEEKFSDLDAIRNHLVNVHKKVFKTAGNGLIAYDLSTDNDMLSCHKCAKQFSSFYQLNRHMNVHFSFVCEICGIGFMSYQRLTKHRIIHDNKMYVCDDCLEIFPTRPKLEYHKLKRHEMNAKKLKPTKCPKCSERFTGYYKRMAHLKKVHGVTLSLECNICKATFSSRRRLTEHTTKLHTKKIECKTCGKCFGTRTSLKMHERSHTGERNFLCSVCNKSYMHQKTLHQHMKVHGSNQISCTECGNEFKNKSEYSKHMTLWHPEIQFNVTDEIRKPLEALTSRSHLSKDESRLSE